MTFDELIDGESYINPNSNVEVTFRYREDRYYYDYSDGETREISQAKVLQLLALFRPDLYAYIEANHPEEFV